MNYPDIIKQLAKEIVDTTGNLDELDGNIDHFLEDLGESVRTEAWEVAKVKFGADEPDETPTP